MKQWLGLIVWISMFRYAYKSKTNFSSRKKALWFYFCGIFSSAAVQDCTKRPSLIKNVPLQLVRNIINAVRYLRPEKRLEKQKDRPNVNVCAAGENFEEL